MGGEFTKLSHAKKYGFFLTMRSRGFTSVYTVHIYLSIYIYILSSIIFVLPFLQFNYSSEDFTLKREMSLEFSINVADHVFQICS